MSYVLYLSIILSLVYWVERPSRNYSKSLNTRKDSGEELENWLKKFSWGNHQSVLDPGKLPEYKFYTGVVTILLQLARKMGGNYQESILYLREGLQSDRQFEKKTHEITLGLYLQMGLMMAMTWIFIFTALYLVEVKMSKYKLVLIFIWQLIGMTSLPFILNYLRKKYFGDIGKIWKILFVLKSLLKVPLSRSEVLAFAGVQELANIKQKSLDVIVMKLKTTCQNTLKMGISYEDDVKYLMGELRFQEKWHFELFEKRLVVIKLVLLSVFFLPSYLSFIFLLLGDLMNLM